MNDPARRMPKWFLAAAEAEARVARREVDRAADQAAATAIRHWLNSGYDVAEQLAHTLCRIAATEADGLDAITRNRPGSWEADLIDQLIRGTAGHAGEYLDQYRPTDPGASQP